MSRLPRPGSDEDIWGDILNDFLLVSHNSDGSLKAGDALGSVVQEVNGKAGPRVTLTAGDVGAATDTNVVHRSGNEYVGGVKQFTSSPVVPTPTQNNQAASKAYVDSQAGSGGSSSLAGDDDVAITSPQAGDTLSYDAGAKKWKNQVPPSAPVSSVAGKTGDITLYESDITSLTSDLAAKAPLKSPTFTGSVTVPDPTADSQAASKAYVDATVSAGAPNASATTPGLIQLTGDLAGSYNTPTVPALANKADQAITITGAHSIEGGGDLSANQTLSLVNDVDNPGNSLYYGTDINGIKGFFAVNNLNPTPVNVCPNFSYSGLIKVYDGDFRWYNDVGRVLSISSVRVALGTAPTGASAIFDVLKNGTSIFTTTANRPTIADGANTALSGTPDVTTVAAGDYLTVSITQIGSSNPGADLTLTVVMA